MIWGWMTSCEITVPAAFGQLSSNFARFTAVCIAIGCFWLRNCVRVAHAAPPDAAIRTRMHAVFVIASLLSFGARTRLSCEPRRSSIALLRAAGRVRELLCDLFEA